MKNYPVCKELSGCNRNVKMTSVSKMAGDNAEYLKATLKLPKSMQENDFHEFEALVSEC